MDYAGDMIAVADELEQGAVSKFNKTIAEFQLLKDSVRFFSL